MVEGVDDPALQAVADYWQAKETMAKAERATRHTLRLIGHAQTAVDQRAFGQACAKNRTAIADWGKAVETVEASIERLCEARPTTTAAVTGMLAVVLNELTPTKIGSDRREAILPGLGGVGTLNIIRRVRDALEQLSFTNTPPTAGRFSTTSLRGSPHSQPTCFATNSSSPAYRRLNTSSSRSSTTCFSLSSDREQVEPFD